MATDSVAKMAAFECPICAPKRYFVTEIGLRTHVADRHPWRSLPPPQTRIPTAKAALADPAWLREQQASAAAIAAAGYSPHQSVPNGRFGPGNNPPQHQGVTFDTQSLLSDEVFFENDLGRGRYQQQQMLQQRMKSQQQLVDPFVDEAPTTIRHPPPDYDPPSPMELSRSLDAIDSIPRKRRDLATSRRPWYDSTDYEGPRNVMDQPGGYYRYDDDEGPGASGTGRNPVPPNATSYSSGRMHRELDDRDSRIETLRMEIDRLWDERMRLLKQEAERSRAVKEQRQRQQQLQIQTRGPTGPSGPAMGYWEDGYNSAMPANAFQGGIDGFAMRGSGRRSQQGPYSNAEHSYHRPVAPHSRLQLYRVQDQQNQQLQHQIGGRAIDY